MAVQIRLGPVLYCCLCLFDDRNYVVFGAVFSEASLAQLVARRSHNPKVVSSILTGGIFYLVVQCSIVFMRAICKSVFPSAQ